MKAWLDVEAGRPDAEDYAAAVVDEFHRHGAFEEYGSPTYYGIDLFALGLWRSRSPSPRLRAWGEELEAALWRDIARWYHAGLRNLCGPFSRAYGMDMTEYAGLLGLWIWDAAGRDAAPFPDLDRPFDHSHDFAMGPVVELVGAVVPPDAGGALATFGGQRLVRQPITDSRVATGWLAPDVMFGAESGGRARASGQYTPVTAHWRTDGGAIGWLRVRRDGPVDAEVSGAGALAVRYDPDDGAGPAAVESSQPFPGTIEDAEPGRIVLRWPAGG
jgi:hypothetical protein